MPIGASSGFFSLINFISGGIKEADVNTPAAIPTHLLKETRKNTIMYNKKSQTKLV